MVFSDKLLELSQNIIVYGHIDSRFVFIIAREEVWLLRKQKLKTVSVSIFGAKVTRSVSVRVLCIYIRLVLHKSLNHTQIAS